MWASSSRVGWLRVLVRTSRHLMNPREWRSSKREATRCRTIRGRAVLTSDGREIGRLSDVLIEEGTGAVSGIEVDARSLGGLRHHLYVIAASQAPHIGPDAIVLPS